MKLIFFFFLNLIFASSTYSQVFTPADSLGYSLIQDSEGSAIYSKTLDNQTKLVLQIVNLRKCIMDIMLGGKVRSDNNGILLPRNHINTWFKKINSDSAFSSYKKHYGDDVISLINGVFFETVSESLYTPLAYPLKYKGEIVSAGASPYNPNTGDYPLKILTIEDSALSISNYNYKTGEPLNNKNSPNQIATLNYQHHPRVIEFPQIKGGSTARFHLITAVDEDGDKKKETIYIISSTNAVSIYQLAGELKKLNNKIFDDDILTLDGGSSISVQDKNGKDLIKPINNVKVPMFIGFRIRGSFSNYR
jgi:hypothetical protein